MDDQLSRPGTDRRAKGALASSNVVYFWRPVGATSEIWERVTSHEGLAAIQANASEFEVLTLFAVPVDELARAPVSTVAAARVALDLIERRTAKVERRVNDRLPDQGIKFEGDLGVLAMKAGANELQSAVERAESSSLKFMQMRTDEASQVVAYIKYLAELAGAAQASRCRAQGGDTNEEAACTASQSQAVPSELVRQLRSIATDPMYADHVHVNKSTLLAAADEIDRLSHSAATGKVPEAIRDVLESARWTLAKATELHALGFNECLANALPKGQADETGCTASQYKAAAEEIRESITKTRDIVRAALASPAAPLAGKTEAPSEIANALGLYEPVSMICAVKAIEALRTPSAPLAAAVPAEEASGLLAECRAVFDLMLDGCNEQKFGDFQNGHGEEIGPRMDALHAKLRGQAPAEPENIQSSALTNERIREIVDENFADDNVTPDDVVFARAIEREILASLSKPTAQGTAAQQLAEKLTCGFCKGTGDGEIGINGCTDCNGKGYVWEPVEPSPSQVTGEVASIDTPEFRDLISSMKRYPHEEGCVLTLVAHINRHIAAQATAGRDAVRDEALEEAARHFEQRPFDQNKVRAITTEIRALKSHAAEQTSGGAK